MPGQTGIEFLEVVRDQYANLPFILFTGQGSDEIASDAISAGVTDYHSTHLNEGADAVNSCLSLIDDVLPLARQGGPISTTEEGSSENPEQDNDVHERDTLGDEPASGVDPEKR